MAPSSFPPDPFNPTLPFVLPDSGTALGSFYPPLTACPILTAPTAGNSQWPWSQMIPLPDQYLIDPISADDPTLEYVTGTILNSPTEESPDHPMDIDKTVRLTHPEDRPHPVSLDETAPPPPSSCTWISRREEARGCPGQINIIYTGLNKP